MPKKKKDNRPKIFEMLENGDSDKVIADAVGCAISTIRRHREEWSFEKILQQCEDDYWARQEKQREYDRLWLEQKKT